jgi:hypothetical protein
VLKRAFSAGSIGLDGYKLFSGPVELSGME